MSGESSCRQFLDGRLLPLALIGEDEFAAFTNKRLRDRVGETPLIRDPEDQRGLASSKDRP